MDSHALPRWSPKESGSASPMRWAPSGRRSPSPISAPQGWEPSLYQAGTPCLRTAIEDKGDHNFNPSIDGFTGSVPRSNNGHFPFSTMPSFVQQPDHDYKLSTDPDQRVPSVPNDHKDGKSEMARIVPQQERTTVADHIGESCNTMRWSPGRSRSSSPAPQRWEPSPSPTRPLFSPTAIGEDDDHDFDCSIIDFNIGKPIGVNGHFPFGFEEAIMKQTHHDHVQLVPMNMEIAVDKEETLEKDRMASQQVTTAISANISRSTSPTRWSPRRNKTPSLSSRPKGTEPSFIPNDVGSTSARAGVTGMPRVADGHFPFGPAPSFIRHIDEKPEGPLLLVQHNETNKKFDNLDGAPNTEQKPGVRGSSLSLTWENLWVTASRGRAGRTPILHGVSGFALPGEVLAIMGPSGCGKSTLLDTLAGRLGSDIRQTGEILLNGQRQTLSFGTSAYVTQDDVLMTTMTVREAVHYSAQLQMHDSMSSSQKRERAEETIREMGLGSSIDTRIGGRASKGLSGGQRRRVSICMEILTRPPLLFLDEPTSGLDSAASYHVMRRITELARREGMTVLAAIHQPSSEVFELFHGLCLLANGRTVYFGPPSMTGEFFALNGFPCPTLSNPSDHYLRTINQDFDEDVEEGCGTQPRITTQVIEILVTSYKSSNEFKQVLQQIAEIHKAGGSLVKKRNRASFFTQSLILIRRSFVNMYRDLGYYWLRFAIYIALCLCVGTIYHNVGKSFGSIQARGSMLMFVAAFLTFMAIGGFPSFVEDMKIFGRERLNGHYGVTAFVIGNTFSSIPYLVLISLIPGAISYYLVGLQRGIEHFVYFTLVLFMCMMVVEGLMMIVASIVPDFLMGIITGAGIQGVMMLNGGFFRLPNDLPKPMWRYPIYYVAFHKYAFQGFYKNEFIGLTFPNNQAGGSPTISGEEILRNIWQVEIRYSKWIDLAILFGMVILYRLLFAVIIKLTESIKPKLKRMMAKATMRDTHVMEQSYDFSH